MKTTTWLCPVLTLLCAIQLVYTAQSSNPATDDLDSSPRQKVFMVVKHSKPSLSIVNPLDVLRQRLLLEIARKQMRENTRQVELNRAILKNVGKRMLNKHSYPLEATAMQWDPLNLYHSQNHQQQHQQQHQLSTMQRESAMHLQPYDLELIPPTLIFDYLQGRRPWLPYERKPTAPVFDNYDMEFNDDVNGGEEGDVEAESDDDVVMGLGKLAMQPMTSHKAEYNGQHKTTAKKSIDRSGLVNGGGGGGDINGNENVLAPLKQQHKTFNNDYKLNDLTTLELNEAASALGTANSNNISDNIKNMDNDDYQIQRYLYHLHKNHLTRK